MKGPVHKIEPLEPARSERSIHVIVAGPQPYYRAIADALAGAGISLIDHVESADALTEKLKRDEFDCIIADQMIGQQSSLELHANLEQRMTAAPALVMVTAESNDKTILRAFRKGASDFVSTDHDYAKELTQAVRTAIERNRKTLMLVDEIEHLSKLARYDRLTGMPNRTFLDDRLQSLIASAERHRGTFAIFLIDINNFRAINDIYGHAIADQALKAFAKRMIQAARTSDAFGRFGGDEFLYLIDRDATRDNVEAVCKRLAAALSFAIELDAITLSMSPSIGGAVFPYDGRTIEELLNSADQATYLAKASGGSYHLARPLYAPAPAETTEASAPAMPPKDAETDAPSARDGRHIGPAGRHVNRRIEHRDRVFRRGRIVLGDGFSTIDCVIRDISTHGARITVDNQMSIPRLISFAVVDTGQIFPAMRRWQRGTSIGIEFAVEAVAASKPKEAAA
ncbi:hypothetical protein BH10PSE9_BH10PSE9_04810 [soil metagenome]